MTKDLIKPFTFSPACQEAATCPRCSWHPDCNLCPRKFEKPIENENRKQYPGMSDFDYPIEIEKFK